MISDKDILLHLRNIQNIVCAAAQEGFNPSKGTWAQDMFNTNRMTSDILRERTGSYNGANLDNNVGNMKLVLVECCSCRNRSNIWVDKSRKPDDIVKTQCSIHKLNSHIIIKTV